MNQHLTRASLLIQQGRFELAKRELAQVLANDSENDSAHRMMMSCLLHEQKPKQAIEHAHKAVHFGPEVAANHLALGFCLHRADQPADAEQALLEALRLNPHDANVYGLLASVQFSQRKWQPALDYAESGLAIDPDDSECRNLRSLTLERLGKSEIAVAAAEESLKRNPQDATTHATHGWALLHNRKHVEAKKSFREALRLDPNNEFARQGMVQALHAHHLLFRALFYWQSWLGRMSGGLQWAIILGLYFGQRVLSSLAQNYPLLKPFVFPIILLYIAFAVSTWIAEPLGNTLLRLNQYGRCLLNRKQIWASNSFLILFIGCATAAITLWLQGHAIFGLAFLGFGLLLTLPLSSMFQFDTPWKTYTMAALTGLLATAGLAAIYCSMQNLDLATAMTQIFIYGAIGSQFLANYFAISE